MVGVLFFGGVLVVVVVVCLKAATVHIHCFCDFLRRFCCDLFINICSLVCCSLLIFCFCFFVCSRVCVCVFFFVVCSCFCSSGWFFCPAADRVPRRAEHGDGPHGPEVYVERHHAHRYGKQGVRHDSHHSQVTFCLLHATLLVPTAVDIMIVFRPPRIIEKKLKGS